MLNAWPLCPRPESNESLRSWFERVGLEYGMSETLLFDAVSAGDPVSARHAKHPHFERLSMPHMADLLTALARLSADMRAHLWPPSTNWELRDNKFRNFCPRCAIEDLKSNRRPYGRQVWQQSWCTLCQEHGLPLIVRRPGRGSLRPDSDWSMHDLKYDTIYVTPDRYRILKVQSESELRSAMLGSLLEIERTMADALSGQNPNRLVWGKLSAEEFLVVVQDVTTWALTHFEPVRAWSIAEELSPVEEQEGYGMVGRLRRMLPSDYRGHQFIRTLRDVTTPRVRGAARWVAHALLCVTHSDASDRRAGPTTQERQAARILRTAPAGREWLADRQQGWPAHYTRDWWITVRQIDDIAVH